jgi:alcohol dehydrogenase
MSSGPSLITLTFPRRLSFGVGCSANLSGELASAGVGRPLVLCSRSTRQYADAQIGPMTGAGLSPVVLDTITPEPTIAQFQSTLSFAREAGIDSVVGIGGGSVLDVAKLVAALVRSDQSVDDTFGVQKLSRRGLFVACIPTTSGTGSEVSPTSVLLDEREHLKKGAVSPHLVADLALVDPALTLSCSPAVTASTGVDALTHCIEAYANRFAHPAIDGIALEGIRLISRHLPDAFADGTNLVAREHVARGSLNGGFCLGPVNTAAIHALSYPLGGEFRVPHGVANAMLMCAVLKFNLQAAPGRYADIAVALGVERIPGHPVATAMLGLEKLDRLCDTCQIPRSLGKLGIPTSAIERMARAAIGVTRLLDRNVRNVAFDDVVAIYRSIA